MHYLPFMLKALYAPSAHGILITAIQRLRGIRLECPVVATTALLKRESHLTFLSGELVIFALFDTKLSGGEAGNCQQAAFPPGAVGARHNAD